MRHIKGLSKETLKILDSRNTVYNWFNNWDSERKAKTI